MSMLKIGATLAVVGFAAAFTSREPAAAAPTPPAGAVKSTLSVSISGPSTPARNVNCQYTAVVSGGTPPYTYDWIGSGLIDGWNDPTATYRWSSIGNKAIHVDVMDALGATGSADLGVTVLSTGSC
ncbi:hypothetical protein [Longimicrobium sp.]|uniref:hypothetical protein n=1 Tax=Longimicrobium sp. TaxID=2029185 RepID=UPI002E37DF02|nr:hypothetical protein [Longimicrobium sp.]HEX6039432.1 hypothetical protein [Longimicrobium sp.]